MKNLDSSGYYPSQLQQIQSHKPIPVKSSAGLSPLEQRAAQLIKSGMFNQAERIYLELLQGVNISYLAYCNYAALCAMSRRWVEAEKLAKKALSLEPSCAEAHNILGLALKEMCDPWGGANSFRAAIRCKRDYAEAYNNLGIILKETGDLVGAVQHFREAVRFKPAFVDGYNNLGNALQELGSLAESIACYRKVLALKPDHVQAFNNLGTALKESGDIIGSIAAYRRALQLSPGYAEAQWNLSLALLLNGDYINGWESYDWRTKKEKEPVMPHALPCCEAWHESSLQTNERLLVVSEQGLGDTLQFMRYVRDLREHGYDILFCAQEKLHSLIDVSGIASSPLTPEQAKNVVNAKWISLLSVPRRLGVQPDSAMQGCPYIFVPDVLSRKWDVILGATPRPVVAINWQGNPRPEQRPGFRGRSLPLETFAPIAAIDGISLLSLQKGYGSEQMASCSFKSRFVECQDQIDETWDFLETAAIIANCDLVVTSDTAIAHLAGGMGRKVWLLLQQVPDWRWGLHTDSTFWYPSMRLFRQRSRGGWDEVIEKVAEELHQELLAGSLSDVSIQRPACSDQSLNKRQ